MLETTTGETVNLTLMHEGIHVRKFYPQLPIPPRFEPPSPGSRNMIGVMPT